MAQASALTHLLMMRNSAPTAAADAHATGWAAEPSRVPLGAPAGAGAMTPRLLPPSLRAPYILPDHVDVYRPSFSAGVHMLSLAPYKVT